MAVPTAGEPLRKRMAEDINPPHRQNPLLPHRPQHNHIADNLAPRILGSSTHSRYSVSTRISIHTRSPAGGMTLPTNITSSGGSDQDTIFLDGNMKISPSSTRYPVSALGVEFGFGRSRRITYSFWPVSRRWWCSLAQGEGASHLGGGIFRLYSRRCRPACPKAVDGEKSFFEDRLRPEKFEVESANVRMDLWSQVK